MINEVAEELRSLARASDDATGYFAALYARVTSRIATSVAQGGFEDGERMDRFATTFAELYTRTYGQHPVRPRCWQATFDVAGDGRLIIVQHLLLGINAHVNHDLAQAVVAVADRTGDLPGVRPDFDAINDILATAYNGLLGDLDRVSRWANEAATLGGGRLFHFSLVRARDQAWATAQRLFPLSEAERAREVAELDRLTSVLAFLITRPGLSGRLMVTLARRFEERDPKKVTAALLGDPPLPSSPQPTDR